MSTIIIIDGARDHSAANNFLWTLDAGVDDELCA